MVSYTVQRRKRQLGDSDEGKNNLNISLSLSLSLSKLIPMALSMYSRALIVNSYIDLSDAAVQFFLNANYHDYKFDEKLEDLGKQSHNNNNMAHNTLHHKINITTFTGSRVQKHWYTVKTVDEEDFMMLTIVILYILSL